MASAAVAYGRMIRPFPTRQLSDITWYATTRAHAVTSRVTELQINPPGDPGMWFFELQQILGDLYVLRDQIEEAVPQIVAMQDNAERDYEVAVDAMRAILAGLKADGDPGGPGDDVEAAEAVSVG